MKEKERGNYAVRKTVTKSNSKKVGKVKKNGTCKRNEKRKIECVKERGKE